MLIFGIAKGITPPEYRDQMAIWVLILAIGLSDWVQFARVVRGATLVEKKGIRPGGAADRALALRDHAHAHPAQRAGPVLVIATISPGAGHHRRGNAASSAWARRRRSRRWAR
jgi:peptide/nickel transport system permease protein